MPVGNFENRICLLEGNFGMEFAHPYDIFTTVFVLYLKKIKKIK